MTPERDNKESLNRRLDQRRQRRQAQSRQQRQAMLRLWMVLLALVMAAGLIVWSTIRAANAPAPVPTEATETTETNPVPSTETVPPETQESQDEQAQVATTLSGKQIHIVAAGDLNVTDEIVNAAMTPSGYDFSDAFLDVAPVLGSADLAILNYEGTIAGTPYGTATGSAPADLAQALANIGVDMVQTANSASIRAGVLGLQSTIAGLENVGITPVGTFMDSDTYRRTGGYTMVEVEGVRIAVVAFTKGMDNLGLPEGSSDCVNLLYKDYTTDYKQIDTSGITSVLRNVAAEEPDLTIALLHWGSENNENISTSQEKIRDLMIENGVDAIIGTHSHLLQAIEFDEGAGTLVAWSLGDFYGNATQPGSNYSVILDLEITRDEATGFAAITDYNVIPIYTLKPEQSASGGQRVVQIEKAIARYESKYIGAVTEDAYNNLVYSLERIEKRIAGE